MASSSFMTAACVVTDVYPAMPLGFSVNKTLGAFSIGIEISMILIGVLTLQTYNYFNRFVDDPLWIKISIALMWCMEVAHAVSIATTNYEWVIIHYGNPQILLQKAPLSLGMTMFFGGLISPFAQSFFAWRLFILSRKRLIPIICWLLALLHLAANILCTVEVIYSKTLPQMLLQWKWLLLLIFSLEWIIDVLIAVCLCYYLYRERGHTLRRTARVLDKLIQYTIQTGLITSIAAISSMIVFLKMPETLIWMALFGLLSRLYSNSLLASLNARAYLGEQQRSGVHTSTALDFSLQNMTLSRPFSAAVMEPDYTTTPKKMGTQAIEDSKLPGMHHIAGSMKFHSLGVV